MWASGPAAAARPVEAGLGPARDGWPPTSALALLVKMAAVSIAATVVQSLSGQRSGGCRLSTVVAIRTRARRARPASLREGMSLPRFDPAAKSCSLEPRPTLPSRLQLLSSPEDWCLICCLPADAAGEPGGPLYYKEALTRFYLEFFYPHDSERECDRTIGSFSHQRQSEISREQLSLPLASPPSPSGIRGILWVVQSIDLWLVSQPHFEGAMKYSDRHLAGLSARPPDRVELNGAGSLGYGTGPSFG
ncbi:hypothetical protein EMIHUDRAFT_439926 [Emiliania huxleyi CCMP1516]|uniref:Uncharacterized protein n=2 Tax=Emiliania huxleyi TaxID=2903 RepID=A0A0D3KU29_EMIH1|nr:hypothetical protein EMIHUDRAFT_439926 [Emiliania huxleyi CCMP1516]EOD39264.1 hypothetical protein EMIHUDRAFT_439926 [Emiliania huxleyi CCMP1516]|eukprot:XP_005791693.1 hypothetical protein EMIHUDRAFT_439926 [Emiliania huxleyi CCMP1516]